MRGAGRVNRREFLRGLGAAMAASAAPLGCGRRWRILDPDEAPAPRTDKDAVTDTDDVAAKDFSPACGIVPPLITPFKADLSIDWDAFDQLVDWHIERGVSGLFVVAGSSEYFRLSEEESLQMASRAVSRAAGRIHVLAGSTNYNEYPAGGSVEAFNSNVAKNIAMTNRMSGTGVDGCFITTLRAVPNDGRTLEQIMLDYYLRVHEETNFPLYAYELPGAPQGYRFSPAALAQLGLQPRYVGVKDTSTKGDLADPVAALQPVIDKLAAVGGTIAIMQANTRYLFESWKIGCTGGINTTANVAPRLFSTLYEFWRRGDLDTAAALQARIYEIDGMLNYGYMKSAKIALGMFGLPVQPYTREPKPDFTSEQILNLRRMVQRIERAERDFPLAPPTAVRRYA